MPLAARTMLPQGSRWVAAADRVLRAAATDVVGGFCAGVAAVLGVALVLDATTLRRRAAAH